VHVLAGQIVEHNATTNDDDDATPDHGGCYAVRAAGPGHTRVMLAGRSASAGGQADRVSR